MKKLISCILITYLSIGLLFGLYDYTRHLRTFKCGVSAEPPGYITISDSFTNPDPSRCKHTGFELKSIATIPILTVGWPIYVVREFPIFEPLENYLGSIHDKYFCSNCVH